MGRQLVAITPINRTLYNAFDFIAAGSTQLIYVENATTTDGFYTPTTTLAPPGGVLMESFYSTSGNLINIALNLITVSKLVEMYIDEAVDQGTSWMRADSVVITTQTPHFTRAFRFICPFLKITIANTGASDIFVGINVRASTS